MTENADFSEDLLTRARAAGFPLAGLVDLEKGLASPLFQADFAYYRDWVGQGRHGAMKYLERGTDRRGDPRIVFPETRTVLSVAIPYPRRAVGAPGKPRYARYLQGSDYHEALKTRLESLMRETASVWDPRLPKPLAWKVCVDTSAVLERTWAKLAGLGWIGKNTLLIHPEHGSYLFLAEVLLNAETGREPAPLSNYCGHCTRCLDACPTNAFVGPAVLNANDCIAYLTLEKRGPHDDKSEEFKRTMGTWIAGCDVCQEVCPFNRKPVAREEASPPPAHDPNLIIDWEMLARETDADYARRIEDSSLERVKRADFLRNLEIARNNSER